MLVRDINPKNEKYCRKLYEYLKRNFGTDFKEYDLNEIKVYWNATKYGQFDINKDLSKAWIGRLFYETTMKTEDDRKGILRWYHGVTYCNIFHSKYQMFANPWWGLDEVIDITEVFWKRYIQIGKCIFADHEYMKPTRTSRKCKHCGKWEKKESRVHKYTCRRIIWV